MKTNNTQLNLYNKYRPKSISELVGQQNIKNLLLQTFNQGKLLQSFIFYGSNGIGKTSFARIVAKAWNCEKFVEIGDVCNSCERCKSVDSCSTTDIYEVDAASHSGVDHMRELINSSRYIALDLKKKIYIIDEAHNLSSSAWNVLLKTIEEPHSENVIFIFITTNIYKIPKTIISRCQKYNFSKISENDLCSLIDRIAAGEDREVSQEVKESLSSLANGSARECITLLEQVFLNTSGLVQISDMERVFSLANKQETLDLMTFLVNKDLISANKMILKFSELNKNLFNLFTDMLSFFVDLYLFEKTRNSSLLAKLKESEAQFFMDKNVNFIDCLETIEKSIDRFSEKNQSVYWAQITLFNLFELLSDSFNPSSKQITEIADPEKLIDQIKESKLTIKQKSEEVPISTNSTESPKKEEGEKLAEKQEDLIYKFSSLEEKKIIYGLSKEYIDSLASLNNYEHYFSFINSDKNINSELFKVLKGARFLKNKEKKGVLITTDKTALVLFESGFDAFKFNSLVKEQNIKENLQNIFIEKYEWFGLTKEQYKKYTEIVKNDKYLEVDKSIFSNSQEIDRFEEAWEFLESKQE